MKILLFSGWMGSGKNYIAEKVKERLVNPVMLYFAYKLKKWVSDLFGLTIEELNELKDLDARIIFGNDINAKEIIIPSFIRKVMQWLGTDVVRSINKNYWTKQVIEEIKKDNNEERTYFITDWRFKNEERIMKQKLYLDNIITIRIEGIEQNGKHKSEMELDDHPVNIVINNVKDNEKLLEENIQKIINYIGETK